MNWVNWQCLAYPMLLRLKLLTLWYRFRIVHLHLRTRFNRWLWARKLRAQERQMAKLMRVNDQRMAKLLREQMRRGHR